MLETFSIASSCIPFTARPLGSFLPWKAVSQASASAVEQATLGHASVRFSLPMRWGSALRKYYDNNIPLCSVACGWGSVRQPVPFVRRLRLLRCSFQRIYPVVSYTIAKLFFLTARPHFPVAYVQRLRVLFSFQSPFPMPSWPPD